MVNYSDAKIYKLVNNVDDKIYIGSTCGTLRLRKSKHKAASKVMNYTVYQHLNEIGWNNVEIILIETFECNNKDELHKRERYWIDELKPELNKQIPASTIKEQHQRKNKKWKDNNKEYISTYNEEYRKKNIDDIKRRESIKITCDCGSTILKRTLNRHIKSKTHINFMAHQQ